MEITRSRTISCSLWKSESHSLSSYYNSTQLQTYVSCCSLEGEGGIKNRTVQTTRKAYRNIWIWRVQPLLPLPPVVLFISNCTYFWLLKKKIVPTFVVPTPIIFAQWSCWLIHFLHCWCILPNLQLSILSKGEYSRSTATAFCSCHSSCTWTILVFVFAMKKISGQRDGISLGPGCIILPLSSKRPNIPT